MSATNNLQQVWIDEAKRLLPMPALMGQLGLGDRVKKNARCPFHDDHKPSFSVFQNNEGRWFFKCFAGCGCGDEINFVKKHFGLSSRTDAMWRYLEMAGVVNNDSASNRKHEASNGATKEGDGSTSTAILEAPKDPLKLRPLHELLDAVRGILRRYVVFQSDEQLVACALWVIHTWLIDAFDFTPYLHVFSTEKRSGKSRLLDVLELLVKRPWRASGEREAVLFRKIQRDKPTILYDEIDTVFHAKKNDGMESTRRMFNLGFTRGNKVSRCVGQNTNFEIHEFETFCPKVLCGIGRCLPDTVSDRALPIELVRQSNDEKARRFRKREAEVVTAPIRVELEAFAQQNGVIDKLRDARPSLPDELSDRQQDISEPLLAIADIAGNHWAETARAALIKLCAQEEDASIGVTLLGDIKTIFDARQVDKLTTEAILDGLVEIEDSPWALMWADDLNDPTIVKAAAKLARMLKGYKRPDGERLKPRTIRIANQTPKGFHRSDFEEEWKRYLPSTPEKTATSATTATRDRANVAAVATVAPCDYEADDDDMPVGGPL